MVAQLSEPFVGLSDYLKWAVEQGCKIQTGITEGPEGMTPFTVVTAGSGKRVVIHDVEDGEYIPVSAYKYYDRRLGLKPKDPLYGAGKSALIPFGPGDSKGDSL